MKHLNYRPNNEQLKGMLSALNRKDLWALADKVGAQRRTKNADTIRAILFSNPTFVSRYEDGMFQIVIGPGVTKIIQDDAQRIFDSVARSMARRSSYYALHPEVKWPNSISDQDWRCVGEFGAGIL